MKIQAAFGKSHSMGRRDDCVGKAEQGVSAWEFGADVAANFLLGLSKSCRSLVIQFPFIPDRNDVMGCWETPSRDV